MIVNGLRQWTEWKQVTEFIQNTNDWDLQEDKSYMLFAKAYGDDVSSNWGFQPNVFQLVHYLITFMSYNHTD